MRSGAAEVSRIFATTLHYPEGDHTFVVTLSAVNADDLAAFADEAQPIIDSLRCQQSTSQIDVHPSDRGHGIVTSDVEAALPTIGPRPVTSMGSRA